MAIEHPTMTVSFRSGTVITMTFHAETVANAIYAQIINAQANEHPINFSGSHPAPWRHSFHGRDIDCVSIALPVGSGFC